MARPRKKYSFITRIKFLITGEVQTVQPRPSRAAKLMAERKKLDKVMEQYQDLQPIK